VADHVSRPAAANAYGFTGQQQFGEANDLVFLRARYYNPSIGRFISKDPILSPVQGKDNFFWLLPYLIGSPQKIHPYVYCSNNPVNDIDPGGTAGSSVICIFIVIGFILTMDCVQNIAKFLDKLNELKKDTNADACNTQAAWNKAIQTKEWKALKWCFLPWYVG
jgi:RHS repeat-associated protein